MTLPTNYTDGQTIHGADVNTWTTAINAIINGTTTAAQWGTTGQETFTISGGNLTQISGTTLGGGSAPSVGDRVLVAHAPAASGAGTAFVCTLQPANGIYVVTSNTTNLSLSRASDMSGSLGPHGVICYVEAGTDGLSVWAVALPVGRSAFTYGTSSMAWNIVGFPFAGYSGGPMPTFYGGTGITGLTFPNVSDTVALLAAAQTLTNKTLTGPLIASDASPTYASGKLVFDTTNDCLTFFNSDSNLALQLGQEQWMRVVNNTGSTIANGQAVYITGASAGLPTIALAKANASTTANAVGLTTESIANGATGVVTTYGSVHGLNTSGFTAGVPVYLDATTAGSLNATAPSAPNFTQLVGWVAVSSATVGVIAVNPETSIQGTSNDISVVNAAGVVTLDIGSNVVTLTGSQTLTSKTLTSPTMTAPALGTPASGTLTNCTFPTLNQSTTGNAATATTASACSGNAATATTLATGRTVQANLASTSSVTFNGSANITPGVTGTLPVGNGGTGAATLTGVVKGTGTTAMVAATAGTDFVAPGGALGTPSSGTLTNCTFPTLNQSTTGNAATATTASACSGNAATATKLATARTINGVSFDGSGNITLPSIPWCPEADICNGTLATGYMDLPGGFAVEPGINASGVTLQSVWIRLGTTSATFAASSVFDVYVGTATTQGTLAVTITMASASNNQIATLGTPVSMSANAVVRINCSTAGAAVTGPIHAQLRGVYNG